MATNLSGPLRVGNKRDGRNGSVVLEQSVVLEANGTNAVTANVSIPRNASLSQILWDNLVAWDSATSATGTVGTAAAGTEVASGINAKTAGRVAVMPSAAQADKMHAPGASQTFYATITPTGATTAGKTKVAFHYIQNI